MPYILTLHLIGDFTWIGCMTATAWLLRWQGLDAAPRLPIDSFVLHRARRLNARVTSGAMILSIATGLYMALRLHLAAVPWMQAKFTLVLVLAGLHGAQARSMRKAVAQRNRVGTRADRLGPACVLGCAAAIVALVVLRPTL